jgi:hypothetical protein
MLWPANYKAPSRLATVFQLSQSWWTDLYTRYFNPIDGSPIINIACGAYHSLLSACELAVSWVGIDFQPNRVSTMLGQVGTKALFDVLGRTFPPSDIATFIKAVKTTKYTAKSLQEKAEEEEKANKDKSKSKEVEDPQEEEEGQEEEEAQKEEEPQGEEETNASLSEEDDPKPTQQSPPKHPKVNLKLGGQIFSAEGAKPNTTKFKNPKQVKKSISPPAKQQPSNKRSAEASSSNPKTTKLQKL